MNEALYQNYLNILKSEMIMALGCTEPIAIAYASAKARAELGVFPERMEVYCSGNIVKNVKGVTVPMSGGMKGIDAAAILGTVGGDPTQELEVLSSVTPEDIAETRRLMKTDFCDCSLEEGVENLYVRAEVFAGGHSASVTIKDRHTHISEIKKDGQVTYQDNNHSSGADKTKPDKSLMDLKGIIQFANEVRMEDISELIGRQVECNSALADEGLRGEYGAQVGRTLLKSDGDSLATVAKARAAAGSDARMNGCPLPAVINSGSGNQGITVSVPVIEYAKAWNCGKEKMYRALVLSNLLSVHQKKYIGSLSAYCGAVSAACSAGAAIMYLAGGDYDAIARTITNTLANTGGIVCDGAKSSCAAKIVSALTAAILAYNMSLDDHVFQAGEGLVQNNVEDTIRSFGDVGKVGMKQTDIEILNIMLNKVDLSKT